MVAAIFTENCLYLGLIHPEGTSLHDQDLKKFPLPSNENLKDELLTHLSVFENHHDLSPEEPGLIALSFPPSAFRSHAPIPDRNAILSTLQAAEHRKYHKLFSGLELVPFIVDALSLNGLSEINNILHIQLNAEGLHCHQIDQNYLIRESSSFPDLGVRSLRDNLLEEINKELAKMSITLNEETQEIVRNQCFTPPFEEESSFMIPRGDSAIKVNTQISISADILTSVLTPIAEKIITMIDQWCSVMEHQGYIVLEGELFDHHLLSALLKEVYSKDKLIQIKTEDNRDQMILDGLQKIALDEKHKLENQQSKIKALAKESQQIEEEINSCKSQIEHQLDLFDEISQHCVDPSQRLEYIKQFMLKGKELGINRLVIQWYIDHTLKKQLSKKQKVKIASMGEEIQRIEASLQASISEALPTTTSDLSSPVERQPTEISTPVSQKVQTLNVKADRKSEKHQILAHQADKIRSVGLTLGNSAKDEETHPINVVASPSIVKPVISLHQMVEVERWMRDTEFSAVLARTHEKKQKVVLRLLRQAANSQQALRPSFQEVYQKEKAYYSWISPVVEVEEGLMYYRPFIEGTPLKNHLIKAGTIYKSHWKKFSYQDILLILKIFDAARNLTYPIRHISDDQIIVQKHHRWARKKEVNVFFTGFTSDKATQAQMEEDLHRTFEKLLQPGVYNDFRNTHLNF